MYYLLKIPLNMNDEKTVVTPSEEMAFDIWHADEAYEHFAKSCYPTTNWEILGPEPQKQNYVIAYSVSIPDIYNELHNITLLIRATDDDSCDDAAAVWILDYLNDWKKELWLLDHNPNEWSTKEDEEAYTKSELPDTHKEN